MKVVKKDGSFQDFSCEKIKLMVARACNGLDVNPLVLESRFDGAVRDGISSTEIQLNLIEHAKALASPSEPDWVYVAGRLLVMDRWATTKTYEDDFHLYVVKQQFANRYRHPALKKYTPSQIKQLGKLIDKNRDLEFSYSAAEKIISTDLLEGENIQQMFMVTAMILASVEVDSVRLEKAAEFFELLSTRWVSLATPFLINLRTDGNTASCFTITMNDTLDSIMKAMTEAAEISKAGGGVGIDFTALRAPKSYLMGVIGAASGATGFMKIANDIAVVVNQAGKRKGAITITMALWNANIIEFLDIHTESGDPRKKCHDIQPQVVVHDLFMRMKDDKNAIWHMFCPFEVLQVVGIKLNEVFNQEFENAYHHCVDLYKKGELKVVTTIRACELWRTMLERAFETGLPYVMYIDAMNRDNPNKHDGVIRTANLCIESFSNTTAHELTHTCNLASVVVGRVPMEKLSYVASVVTRMLDNSIELTKSPLVSSTAHNKRYRTIGVGVQGLHDIIAREWRSYKDVKFITEVFERIEYGTVSESIRLAKERGAFPVFKGSMWDTGEKFHLFKKHSVCVDLDWDGIYSECQNYGMRNSQTTSPAPNTSTSIRMDAAAGVMPVYGSFFYESNGDSVTPVAAMHLKSNPLSYSRNIGTYKPAQLVPAVAAAQKFVDTGISAEYVVNLNDETITALDIAELYHQAWVQGSKGVYYLRTVKKGEQLVKEAEGCASCAG